MMEYKGYIGRVEFDDDAGVFHGEVVNTRDVITFQGESVAGLKRAFRDSVDDYLAFCRERGEPPDKPFSGQFLTRIPPDLHRQVNTAAALSNQSLNAWVRDQLENAVARALPTRKSAGKKTASQKGKASRSGGRKIRKSKQELA